MRLIVAAVGRLKDAERELCERYVERFDAAGRALKLGPLQISEISESRAATAELRKTDEAQRLLKAASGRRRDDRARRRRAFTVERDVCPPCRQGARRRRARTWPFSLAARMGTRIRRSRPASCGFRSDQ